MAYFRVLCVTGCHSYVTVTHSVIRSDRVYMILESLTSILTRNMYTLDSIFNHDRIIQ